jgi:hypothetical protein
MAGRATKTRDSVVPSKAAAEPPPRGVAPPIATSEVEAERSSSVQTWAQTPLVEPGETLVVDLLVNPVRPFKTQHYLFQLFSRSVEQEGAPLVEEDASVYMVRPSLLRRLFPYLVVLGVTVITISLYVIFLTNAGILE